MSAEPLRTNEAIAPLPTTQGGFQTIMADPPWRFQNRTGKVAPEHRRLDRYSTMDLDDICGLPVQDVVARNIRGTQAIFPRHPLGGEKRALARGHIDFTHGGDAPARHAGDGHGPVPAAVPRCRAREPVGRHPLLVGLHAQVLADVVGGSYLQHRRPGQIHRVTADRVEVCCALGAP